MFLAKKNHFCQKKKKVQKILFWRHLLLISSRPVTDLGNKETEREREREKERERGKRERKRERERERKEREKEN